MKKILIMVIVSFVLLFVGCERMPAPVPANIDVNNYIEVQISLNGTFGQTLNGGYILKSDFEKYVDNDLPDKLQVFGVMDGVDTIIVVNTDEIDNIIAIVSNEN